MNLKMHLLGDLLTTRPIQTGWEFTMELYPSGQLGFIEDPDHPFGNGSVWSRTRIRSEGPEPLLTLVMSSLTNEWSLSTLCTVHRQPPSAVPI